MIVVVVNGNGDEHRRELCPSRRHQILVWVLVVFGFITGFSIGIPFLLLGLLLAALSPFRANLKVFWPTILAYVAFIGALILASPVRCSQTVSDLNSIGRTTCTSLVGIDYSGAGNYNPSHLPALITAVIAGAVVAVAASGLFRRAAG